jgi:hypothetical protein
MYGAGWQLGCKDSVELHYIKSAVQKSVSTTTILSRCSCSTDTVPLLKRRQFQASGCYRSTCYHLLRYYEYYQFSER